MRRNSFETLWTHSVTRILFGPMKRRFFSWSCVQIIVGVSVSEIQTAACALVLLSWEEPVTDARFDFQQSIVSCGSSHTAIHHLLSLLSLSEYKGCRFKFLRKIKSHLISISHTWFQFKAYIALQFGVYAITVTLQLCQSL